MNRAKAGQHRHTGQVSCQEEETRNDTVLYLIHGGDVIGIPGVARDWLTHQPLPQGSVSIISEPRIRSSQKIPSFLEIQSTPRSIGKSSWEGDPRAISLNVKGTSCPPTSAITFGGRTAVEK